MDKNLIFHQLFESNSSTYTYLLADALTKQAILIDPVIETIDRDLSLLSDLDLKLLYVLDTHVHADHITAAGELRKRTGAKTCLAKNSKVDCVDIELTEGHVIKFGPYSVSVIETFGHTDNSICFHIEDMLFTGDTLLVRGCGRTDFQSGSAEQLYESITQKLFTLLDDTVIYPGHDYKGFTKSTIKEEKLFNPRLSNKTKEQFVEIMNGLNLSYPKQIDKALPANMSCGVLPSTNKLIDVVPEISVEKLNQSLLTNENMMLVDVRRIDEFNGELGHIKGARLLTLGDDLELFLNNENRQVRMVFICRSGKRSEEATKLALSLGYKNIFNLAGGMIRWNENKLPVIISSEGLV